MIRPLHAVAIGALLVLSQGCSVRQMAASSIGDALAGGGDAYASDDDIELVGAATPFGLKTIESLLGTVPAHRGLLLAAARGFTQYSYVWVQTPAEEMEEHSVHAAYAQYARARKLYLRARDYGLRALGVTHEAMRTEPAAALAQATREDLPLLYWTALAWGAAIALSKDDPATIAGLPAVDALVQRAARLDLDWDHGALRSFLIGYELSRPNAAPDAVARARRHFERAVELSGGQQAAPYVSLAESVAVARRDRAEYEALLRQALAVDPDRRPDWRLANLVMQRRARWLLGRAEQQFPE
jgi:predicted anti-sigma-YlaC factor YlaD